MSTSHFAQLIAGHQFGADEIWEETTDKRCNLHGDMDGGFCSKCGKELSPVYEPTKLLKAIARDLGMSAEDAWYALCSGDDEDYLQLFDADWSGTRSTQPHILGVVVGETETSNMGRYPLTNIPHTTYVHKLQLCADLFQSIGLDRPVSLYLKTVVC